MRATEDTKASVLYSHRCEIGCHPVDEFASGAMINSVRGYIAQLLILRATFYPHMCKSSLTRTSWSPSWAMRPWQRDARHGVRKFDAGTRWDFFEYRQAVVTPSAEQHSSRIENNPSIRRSERS